jgi:hypothetical protein
MGLGRDRMEELNRQDAKFAEEEEERRGGKKILIVLNVFI